MDEGLQMNCEAHERTGINISYGSKNAFFNHSDHLEKYILENAVAPALQHVTKIHNKCSVKK